MALTPSTMLPLGTTAPDFQWPENQKASLGCNLKWKAGNAPEYF